MMQTRQGGLTLVELMVVVAVMAIIATIAYPIYTNQVQKSRRADAKVALETIASAQERFYTINGSYGSAANLDDPNGDGDDVDSMIDPVLARLDRNNDGSPDNYAISVTNGGQTFTVTATAQGPQAGDSACATFTINQKGETSPASGCW
ncbi:MAG: type IV pilin protein [Chromatiaceae bacterium]|nr:type IV pilin protein [Chromatiaceae bacterium]MCP5437562.1 type IV pilin protein [Chromatiaceae bacterium]MCP5439678.1 type IV pilin protein [Chromatiaceae bacterium]